MRVRRTDQMRQEGVVHPTRILIINAAAAIMKSKGVSALHIDDVLEATGLTRGAVYHHFANVDDLVESALVATYAEGIEANIRFVRSVLANARTRREFRKGILEANTLYTQNRRLREVRKLRAHAMAIAEPGTAMAESLAAEQDRLTDAYVEVISQAQEKGWVRSTIDARALAVFIQAYSFGAIVDDVSGRPIPAPSWSSIIESFFEGTVFTD